MISMPRQEIVVERYWCPGPWPWQWFRMCTREVTKWCYYFDWVKEHRWFIICIFWGCEDGVEYRHVGPCLGFGSHTFYNLRLCYSSPLTRSGTCASSSGGYGSRYGLLRALSSTTGQGQNTGQATRSDELTSSTVGRQSQIESRRNDVDECVPCKIFRSGVIGVVLLYLLRKLSSGQNQ